MVVINGCVAHETKPNAPKSFYHCGAYYVYDKDLTFDEYVDYKYKYFT